MLKKLLSSSIDGFLEKRDQYREHYTPPDILQDFIRLFHPLYVGKELIRLGGDEDGGYLVPNDLQGIVGCFSPGVSSVADFETDLVRKFDIPCFLADASVEAPPTGEVHFDFEKKFLGSRNDDVTTTLQSWVDRKIGSKDGDLILQMDIEGGEFEVLADVATSLLNRFRIMVLELHYLEDLFRPGSFKYMSVILRKLLSNHTVVHLHPNNWSPLQTYRGVSIPPLLEITLLRNDRFDSASNQLRFPHPLDRRNVSDRDDFPLPKSWYGDSARL